LWSVLCLSSFALVVPDRIVTVQSGRGGNKSFITAIQQGSSFIFPLNHQSFKNPPR